MTTGVQRGGLRALMLGGPGAGKGTHGRRIADDHGVPHISTGALLRDEVARATPLGLTARGYMERGELLPDDLVGQVVVARITGPGVSGFVLDGFPRTLPQAEAAYLWGADRDLNFHVVLHLDVPFAELARRLQRRAVVENRLDDAAEVAQRRLDVYEAATEPLLDFYGSRGILRRVDGCGTIDEVQARVDAVLAPVAND